jgi:hypothetical protein
VAVVDFMVVAVAVACGLVLATDHLQEHFL